MHRANYVCSTPELGQNRTISDIALSEIRKGGKSPSESIDSFVNHKTCRVIAKRRGKHRVKTVKKKFINAPKNLATDSNSDSEFETVNEYETSGDDIESSGNDLPKNRLFSGTNNSTAADSPVVNKLFVSPNPEKWENYEKLLDVSEEEEVEMPKSSSEMFSSLELQESFRDSATFKPYVVPAPVIENKQKKKNEKKKKLTVSEVSFSLKWPNPVASKYNSPSEIPSREDTRRCKYSHLNVQRSDKFKRFVSPRKRPSRSSSAVDYSSYFDEEDVHHVPMRKDSGNEFKFVVKPLRERYSKNDNTSLIDRTIGRNLSLIFEESVEKNSTIENLTPEKSEFDLLKARKHGYRDLDDSDREG